MVDFWGWLNSIPTALQPQVFTAATQFSIFSLGFLTILGTAWANRRNTLKAARDAQKLEIYNLALGKIQTATEAQRKVSSYLTRANMAIRMHADLVQQGIPSSIPSQRFTEFSSLHFEQGRAAGEVHLFLEEWAIIDPRLQAFRMAFGFQSHTVSLAFAALSRTLMTQLPTDNPQGGTFPYAASQGRHIDDLELLAEAYQRESGLVGAYLGDLNVELQQLLLGHLFNGRVVRRDAPDPAQFAIRLDRHREIIRHFQATDFFKNGARLDTELRAAHRQKRPSWWQRLLQR